MRAPDSGPPPGGDGRDGSADGSGAGDAELMARVRAAGLGSAELNFLLGRLVPQAIGALIGMGRSGELFAEVAERVGARLPRPPARWPDDAEDLIRSAVVDSVRGFVDRSVFGPENRRWQPDGGASIARFFITQCLFKFKDYYEVYVRKGGLERPAGTMQEGEPGADDDIVHLSRHRRMADDPETVAVQRDEIRRAKGKMSKLEFWVAEQRAAGKTYVEIARALGMTAHQVRNLMLRVRRRFGC